MASVIIAKNQTAGALPLDDIPIPDNSLPASPAAVTLTNYATVAEIQGDTQLAAYVAVSDVILNVDGTDLTSTEAGNALSTVVSTSTTTITTATSTAGGAANAGKVLELDAAGKADGLIAGDAVAHIASMANPHGVTAAQAGASALGHTHVESDITDLTHTDANAIHDNVAAEITAITAKTTLVDADTFIIEDSAAANAKKSVTFGNMLDSTSEYFEAYDAAGGHALDPVTDVWKEIPLDTERVKDAPFTHSTVTLPAEVTINITDTYLVIARVTTDVSSGTTRSQAEMRVCRDVGAGFVEVPGSIAEMYARTFGNGEATGTVAMVLALTAGDKLRIEAKRDAGSNLLQTHPDGSSLILIRLKGRKGDKGDTGAGSSISLETDGTPVTNTPHDTLNLISPIAVADNADGSADISAPNATASQTGWATATQITKLDGIEALADVTDAVNVAAAGAVMDSDIAEAEGFVRKTGVGTYEAIKSNLAATTAPTINDDSVDGYSVGSIWIDTTADRLYYCLDATLGSAVWVDLRDEGIFLLADGTRAGSTSQAQDFQTNGIKADVVAESTASNGVQLSGTRHYADSATDPSSPTPADGDRYYNTTLDMEMRYDGTRAKWLSVETLVMWFGEKQVATGSYFEGPTGLQFTSSQGVPSIYNGTVIGMSLTRSDSAAATVEVVRNGTLITGATLASSSTGIHSDLTLNSDFTSGGVLGVKNQSGGNDVLDTMGFIRIKWRA
jgi:hypothetical protein